MVRPTGPRWTPGAWRSLIAAVVATTVLFGLGDITLAAADPTASAWFETEQGRVRLIAAAPQIGATDTLRLGLEFRLAPGWKIYWRAPGDAGLPPSLDWADSRNLAAAEIAWPAPRRFTAYGLETIGYEDAVVLPITARLERQGAPLSLRAAFKYLTCKDICIPYEGTLSLDLPTGEAASGSAGSYAELIEQYAREVPGDGTASGIVLSASRILPGKSRTLELSLASELPMIAPDAFVEGPVGVAFGAPRVQRASDGRSAILDIPVSETATRRLDGESLRVTIVDGARALDRTVTPRAAAAQHDPALFLVMLGVALLGGFILNFMPCVLPVLSIKLLAVASHAGRTRAGIRRGFLASAAGIVSAFLLLAAAMLALKAAGLAVGWGLQFQHPGFLVLMATLLTLFACNLAGLFEIPLPQWIAGLAADHRGGLAGDFFAGAFATLLATPCSAPFLGTAVGFALAGDTIDIITIFLALGIGLAVPYLAVAALPALASRLPRPGRWMLVVRRVLAALLALSALWLLSVLAAQAGDAAAIVVALALIAVVAGVHLARLPGRRFGGGAPALLLAFAAPAVLTAPPQSSLPEGTLWRSFDQPEIDRLVQQGKIVFVDVTADWCLNCKVNERLVLQSEQVFRRLSRPDIVAMRADWTRPNDAISAFLRSFGRYGIPFYAVYGPATPDGQPLSEILTPGEVLGALGKAAPPARPVAAATAQRSRDGG